MRLSTKIWLWFGAVWFGTEFVDYLMPPANTTFNAALALVAVIACVAEHFDERSAKP